MNNQQMYNLVYFIGGKQVETVESNKPRTIVMWKKKQLEESNNYLLGKLVPIKC